jgi:DNA primase
MAGFFSDAIREQIRGASDIVDVIGSAIPLKRAGANFVALCPFHKEKTPSFNVNPQRQIFHCFGCHKGGDVFKFVMEFEGLDFPEAVRRLAERAKIPIETDPSGGESVSRHLKETLLHIHEQIAQRWQNALANDAAGQIARDYLVRRGVSSEAINLFRLGYAPDTWDDTVNWAKSRSFELAIVEQAGLILRKEGTQNFYDRFRGRLVFPICDEQGRVIGFSGRILEGDEKAAKYVNSPETPIFTKSKVFFGLNKSKRALLDAETAIVCEGQLDLISCFMAGVENIVAPQGTAFTSEHARILKRYVQEVVLCFDSDEAGQKAAVRSMDTLLASDLAVRVAVVPPPHDPDSFVKAFGGAVFKELIDKAEGYFDFLLNRLCSTNEVTSDKGRLAVLREMAEAVHKTGNVVLIDKYAQKTALRLGVSPDSVRIEFKKLSRVAPKRFQSQGEASAQTEAQETRAEPPGMHEFWLLKLIFLHEDLVAWAASHLDVSWLEHPAVVKAVSRRLDAHTKQSWTSLAAFLSECGDFELQSLLTEATAQERPVPNPVQQLSDVVLRLRNQYIDRKLAALIHQAAQPGISAEEQEALLRRQQELRLLKRHPLSEHNPPNPG